MSDYIDQDLHVTTEPHHH